MKIMINDEKDNIDIILKTIMNSFDTGFKDKLKDLNLLIYGNFKYQYLFDDKVVWNIDIGDYIGGIKLSYFFGTMVYNDIQIKVILFDDAMKVEDDCIYVILV